MDFELFPGLDLSQRLQASKLKQGSLLQQQQLQQTQREFGSNTSSNTSSSRRILKTFLINGELNKLKFRIRPDYIPKHVQRFEGRDVILTADHWHPRYEGINWNLPTDLLISNLLTSQKSQSVGKILKVESNRIINGGFGREGHEYNAYIELTDPKAIKAYDNGQIPNYVSPTIYKLNKEDPDDWITDYEPLHVAFVDIPAWGNVARIKGSCQGDLMTCQNQLKNNAIPPTNPSKFRDPNLLCNFIISSGREVNYYHHSNSTNTKEVNVVKQGGESIINNKNKWQLLQNFISVGRRENKD